MCAALVLSDILLFLPLSFVKMNTSKHEQDLSVDRLSNLEIGIAVEECKNFLDNHFVLRPLRSKDPNDPLNWPAIEKYATYLSVCIFAFLATTNASNLIPAVVPLTKAFHKDLTGTGHLVCFKRLFLDVGSLV